MEWEELYARYPYLPVIRRVADDCDGGDDFDSSEWVVLRGMMQLPATDAVEQFWGPPLPTSRPEEFGALAASWLRVEGANGGPLDDLTFVIQENFEVRGRGASHANIAWQYSHHKPAKLVAEAPDALLSAGATLVGLARMDELALGFTGRHHQFGTPTNPSAPAYVPGGASSGSAVAVAGGLVDFALGTDSRGGVRVPASFCGLYGFRPTHGRISTRGILPLSPKFDTVGWFSRTGTLLRRVGRVVLGNPAESEITSVRVCDDLFALADEPVRHSLQSAITRLSQTVEVLYGSLGVDLVAWAEAFQILEGHQIWQTLGRWISDVTGKFRKHPELGEPFSRNTAEFLEACASITDLQVAAAERVLDEARAVLTEQTAGGVALCFPTTPWVAPPRDYDEAQIDAVRPVLEQFMVVASLGGAPQISLPLGHAHGRPCGLSLLGPRGSDEALLALSAHL